MEISYKEIELSDKPIFDYYFSLRPFENSEFTFTNLFIWRHSYKIEFAVIEDHLCLAGCYKNHFPILFPPVGKDLNKTGIVLERMIEDYKRRGFPIIIKGITEFYRDLFEQWAPGLLNYEEDYNNYDYVYLSKDLIKLEGRAYHSKRNHINQFIKSYEYQYESINENNIEECMIAEMEWAANRRDDPDLLHEKEAIMEALRNFDALQLKGGALRIDNKIQAFSLGELLNPDMAVIHIEKANINYKGCYAMINQQFAEHEWSQVTYINREEDMGIPGLRKAKESYHPVKMIKKFTGTLGNE